jgi:hypothetical protein
MRTVRGRIGRADALAAEESVGCRTDQPAATTIRLRSERMLAERVPEQHEGGIVLSLSQEMGRSIVAAEGHPNLDEIELLHAALFDYVDGDGDIDVVLDLRQLSPTTHSATMLLASTVALVRARGGRVLDAVDRHSYEDSAPSAGGG